MIKTLAGILAAAALFAGLLAAGATEEHPVLTRGNYR